MDASNRNGTGDGDGTGASDAGDGTAATSGAGGLATGSFALRDAYRQRFYFEPLGLWVQVRVV